MKTTEKILLALLVCSVIMNLNLIPGGGILSPLTFMSLAIYYGLPGAFKGKTKSADDLYSEEVIDSKPGENKKQHSSGTSIALSISLIAILFKLMSYPGAMLMLNSAIVALLVVGVLVGKKYTEEKSEHYKLLLLRLLAAAVVVIFLLSLPKGAILNFKYRHHPALKEAILKSWADPNNDSLRNNVEIERDKLHEQ